MVLLFNLVQIIAINVFLIFKSGKTTLDHTHQLTLELAEQLLKSSKAGPNTLLLSKTATPVAVRRSKSDADDTGRYTRPHFPSRIGSHGIKHGKRVSNERGNEQRGRSLTYVGHMHHARVL